jgi:hypothetical protein
MSSIYTFPGELCETGCETASETASERASERAIERAIERAPRLSHYTQKSLLQRTEGFSTAI